MHSEPFICGVTGDQDTGGLHDGYMICPMYGSDYVEAYSKAPRWKPFNSCKHKLDTKLVIKYNELFFVMTPDTILDRIQWMGWDDTKIYYLDNINPNLFKKDK